MNVITMKQDLRHAAVVASVVAFWAAAALLVLSVGPLAMKVGVILVVAFAFMRLIGRDATFDVALFAGIAWSLLSIAAEVFMSAHRHGAWHELLGTQTVLLFAWVAAPALFARKRS